MQNRDEFDESLDAGPLASLWSAMSRRNRPERRRGPLSAILPLAAIVVIVGGVIWYAYPQQAAKMSEQAAPIIRADSSPYKKAPEPGEEGGMDVPYRDSTVFETVRPDERDEARERVENLLPEPEQPMKQGQAFSGVKTETTQPVSEPVAEPVTPEPEAKAVEVKPAVKSVEKPVAKAAEKPAAKSTTTSAAGKFYVQLGSVKTRPDAEKAWTALQKEFSGSLGGLSHRVQEANLGSKGTYYRIQGGPVSEDKARAACKAINAKKSGGCIAVKG